MADEKYKPDAGSRKYKSDPIENHDEHQLSEEDEPNFCDPEDYEDDVTDEDLLGDLLPKRPSEKDGIDSVIVVDNVPKVQRDSDRFNKLQSILRKIFESFGKIVNEFYPTIEDGSTKGYIFIEYASPTIAQEAMTKANGYKMDKSHTLLVNLFSDFDKYGNGIKDGEQELKPQPYVEQGNLRDWLQDEDASDQFAIIYEEGYKTGVMKHRPNSVKVLQERVQWTETIVRWSPMGKYLATFHSKGVALWGGSDFKQLNRFLHPGVQVLDFSPCERYLVTFSSDVSRRDDQQSLMIWDIMTGQKKRGFHCENCGTWPIIKWNSKGDYFARLGTDTISVYEVPSFGLLDKKSLKVDGIKDFCWSPTDNIISYWVPEQENQPCKVALVAIPKRKEICTKNLFNVADCKIHWQKNGDFMCVKVDRYSKAKKVEEKDEKKYSGIYYNFELFRIREKQIPIEKVECKEPVIAFAWEPNGNKFAFLHGESTRISLSFYAMKSDKVELLKTFEKRVANTLFWSPNGQFIVAAGLRNMNGSLEFIDTGDMSVMSQSEHFMATDIDWDPSGRYVVTSVSWWGHKVDNAYWIHNFQGRVMQKQTIDKFCLFAWRPRPPSLLEASHLQEIKKNFKKYAQQFEIKDKISQTTASKELIDKRRSLMQEFNQYRKYKQEQFENTKYKQLRLDMREGIDTDQLESHTENFKEEQFEFLIEIKEIIVEE